MSSCWAPQGIRPSIPSHYMREYRYCYGAVDAYTVDAFFIIAGACNTAWMNEFLQELSAYYSDDYLILVMDNVAQVSGFGVARKYQVYIYSSLHSRNESH